MGVPIQFTYTFCTLFNFTFLQLLYKCVIPPASKPKIHLTPACVKWNLTHAPKPKFLHFTFFSVQIILFS